jgi:hypothetical protein
MMTTVDNVDINECIKLFEYLSDDDADGNTDVILNKQVANWLTELKEKRSQPEKKEVSLKIKKTIDLPLLSKQIFDSIREIYNTDDISITINNNNNYVILTPFCLIELNKGKFPFMVVSFEHNTTLVAIGNLMLLLSSLFKGEIIIGDELYMIDPITGDWIWGEKNIKSFYERNYGKKISPVIHYGWFDDQSDKGLPHC